MKPDLDRVFTELTPPQGGAERFAERLAAAASPDASRRRGVEFAAASAAGVLVVAIILLLGQRNESPPIAASPPSVDIYDAQEFDRLLGRPTRPAELAVVVNAEVATVTEVATTNDKVRIYRVN